MANVLHHLLEDARQKVQLSKEELDREAGGRSHDEKLPSQTSRLSVDDYSVCRRVGHRYVKHPRSSALWTCRVRPRHLRVEQGG